MKIIFLNFWSRTRTSVGTKLWGRTRTQNLTSTCSKTSDLDMPMNTASDKRKWFYEPTGLNWFAIFNIVFALVRYELWEFTLIFDRETLSELSFRNILALVRSGFLLEYTKNDWKRRHYNNWFSRRNSFGLKSVLLDSYLSDLSHSVVTSNDLINFKLR